MPVLSGLEALRKRIEELKNARDRDEIPVLKIKANEIALFRFITDGKDFQTPFFHSVARRTNSGKVFTEEVYCTAEDEDCVYCEATDEEGNPSNESKTRVKIMAWVWVKKIYHAESDDDGKWKKEKRGGFTFYVEDVDGPMILKTGEGWGGYISQKFIQYMQKYGTLLDRDYEWVRQGSGMSDTTYDLLPEDPSNAPKEIKKLSLPDLLAVAKKEITSLDPAKAKKGKKVKKEESEPEEDEIEDSEDLITALRKGKGV